MKHKITAVAENSIAEELGIKPGDYLLAFDEQPVEDILDYEYYQSKESFSMSVMDASGEVTIYDIDKYEDEIIGLSFENDMIKLRHCCNKCLFCFVDQLPPNMRSTMYIKDDDWRMSFIMGNYVTLTNLDQKDIDRIIDMRLNINISVHTTNPELRCTMMHNRFAGEKLKYLKQFADAGIAMNCQIVLCPGINDGDELRRTLTDLGNLMPNIKSAAVVPVGVTKFRDGLYPLEKFNKETAGQAIDLIESFQAEFLEKYGKKGVRMCILTANETPFITAPLKRCGLDGYFERIYSTRELGLGKDIPDSFLKVLSDFDTEASDAVVFEDAFYAAVNAAKARISIVGICDPSEPYAEEMKNLCDRYVSDFTELL